MSAQVNKVITGTYDHTGESVIYGDTDSVYFSAYPTLKTEIDAGNLPWSKDNVITLYDQVAEEANDTFENFMYDALPSSKVEQM